MDITALYPPPRSAHTSVNSYNQILRILKNIDMTELILLYFLISLF